MPIWAPANVWGHMKCSSLTEKYVRTALIAVLFISIDTYMLLCKGTIVLLKNTRCYFGTIQSLSVVEIQNSWFWNLKSCICVSIVSNTYRIGKVRIEYVSYRLLTYRPSPIVHICMCHVWWFVKLTGWQSGYANLYDWLYLHQNMILNLVLNKDVKRESRDNKNIPSITGTWRNRFVFVNMFSASLILWHVKHAKSVNKNVTQ